MQLSPQEKRALRKSPPKLAGQTLSVPVMAIELTHERDECDANGQDDASVTVAEGAGAFVEDKDALAAILGNSDDEGLEAAGSDADGS